MDISYSTPVTNLKSSNGYGHAGQKIVNSLIELGHNVSFQNSKYPVQLNFSQPPFYKLHRNQYQISYTPWESTVIPKEWFEMINHCDEVWTTSDWCANIFEDHGIKNVKVYPHGIDKIWTAKKREVLDTLKFLHVGEPAPRKSGQMTVEAFAHLFGNNPRYSLTIKSSGHNTTRIYQDGKKENMILGDPSQVYNNIFIINKDLSEQEMVDLYHDHHVLIYPTYGEGFGFIPLQALATGMPTISTYDWSHYSRYIGPLKLNSLLTDSIWKHPHEGKMFTPNYQHLLELMTEVSLNFNQYSDYYYNQSTDIHKEYDWLRLTNNSFSHIFKKFS
jgi:hypothetical protein